MKIVKVTGEEQKNLLGQETGYVIYKKTVAEKLELAAKKLRKLVPVIKDSNRVLQERDLIIRKAQKEAEQIRQEEILYREKRLNMEKELSILKDFIKKQGYDIKQVLTNGFEEVKMKIKNHLKM